MAFTCPRCGIVSHNPNDKRERYCGRCHEWFDPEVGVLCWFCPVCATATLLANAERGQCCVKPRRADCPLPIRGEL